MIGARCDVGMVSSSLLSKVASLSDWLRALCMQWERRCWCGVRGLLGLTNDGGGGGGSVEVEMSVPSSWIDSRFSIVATVCVNRVGKAAWIGAVKWIGYAAS